jgi:hypothetical protein
VSSSLSFFHFVLFSAYLLQSLSRSSLLQPMYSTTWGVSLRPSSDLLTAGIYNRGLFVMCPVGYSSNVHISLLVIALVLVYGKYHIVEICLHPCMVDGQTSWVYPSNPVQYLYISCYVAPPSTIFHFFCVEIERNSKNFSGISTGLIRKSGRKKGKNLLDTGYSRYYLV